MCQTACTSRKICGRGSQREQQQQQLHAGQHPAGCTRRAAASTRRRQGEAQRLRTRSPRRQHRQPLNTNIWDMSQCSPVLLAISQRTARPVAGGGGRFSWDATAASVGSPDAERKAPVRNASFAWRNASEGAAPAEGSPAAPYSWAAKGRASKIAGLPQVSNLSLRIPKTRNAGAEGYRKPRLGICKEARGPLRAQAAVVECVCQLLFNQFVQL